MAQPRKRALNKRIEELEKGLKFIRRITASEWKKFADSQNLVPAEHQLGYEAWFALIWVPRISAIETECSILRAQLIDDPHDPSA
jgi:hypothetical protein